MNPERPSSISSKEKGSTESGRDIQPSGFDFEAYRVLLDQGAVGSRKIGLMDPDMAQQAFLDQRTVLVNTQGMSVPAIVPIEYVEGWDQERARRIAQENDSEGQEVYYLALSGDMIEQFVRQPEALADLASKAREGLKLYFEHTLAQDDKVVENLGRLLSAAGLSWHELPLMDSQAQEGREQASMSFYAALTHHTSVETTPLEPISIYERFEQLVAEGKYEKFPENGPTILGTQDLDQHLRDQLWDLYEQRFQDLGENHPISMEDNRDFFEQLIETQGTTLSVYFNEGRPVAFMFFMTSPESISWINSDFIEEHTRGEERFLFFPGIVARADGVGHYAEPVIQLPTHVISQTSLDYRVCFESTNRSSGYIPRLVEDYVNATAELSIDPPAPIDTTYYRCLEVKGA